MALPEHRCRCLMIERVTHDTSRIIISKPDGYQFKPGHSAMVGLTRQGLENLRRPFTFISTNDDKVLSFIIKDYPQLDGLSTRLQTIKPGEEILVSDPFGSINYTRKGTFIAAGVGITPFLAILRQLHKDGDLEGHRLLYSNKTAKDIIYEPELRSMLGDDLVITLTREQRGGYRHGRIDEEMLKEYITDPNQPCYICGSGAFIVSMRKTLRRLQAQVHEMDMG